MKHISSKDNTLFKFLYKLSSSGRQRRQSRKTLLDGIHLVESCVEAGHIPESLFIRESGQLNQEILSLVDKLPLEPVLLSDSLFDRISPVATPSGLLALIAIPESKEQESGSCVFLDDIQDPGNLGAIFRSAAASGLSAAYLSNGCADAWSPKTLRSGMGAHFHLSIHVDADLSAALQAFSGRSVAMTLNADLCVYDLDLKGAVGFVIGNEGAGISKEILALADIRAGIPMSGRMESLNAASAAAICFFERIRQTRFNGLASSVHAV